MNWYPLRTVVVAAASLSCFAEPAIAQSPAPPFLAPEQAVRIVMDGRPWSAQSADGKNLTITLNRDGTGSAKGPMPFALAISWERKGQEICLNVGPGGVKCVRFRQVAGGLEGWKGNQLDLRLTR